jgi:hypothetical protein
MKNHRQILLRDASGTDGVWAAIRAESQAHRTWSCMAEQVDKGVNHILSDYEDRESVLRQMMESPDFHYKNRESAMRHLMQSLDFSLRRRRGQWEIFLRLERPYSSSPSNPQFECDYVLYMVLLTFWRRAAQCHFLSDDERGLVHDFLRVLDGDDFR